MCGFFNESFPFLRVAAFNPAMVDGDVQELIKFYRSFGFRDVKVTRELVYTDDRRDVIIFHIIEGVRYRVADTPRASGVKSMLPEPLEALEMSARFRRLRAEVGLNVPNGWYGFADRIVQEPSHRPTIQAGSEPW